MPISKIETKTLRQKVYDQIRESIMSAEMEPGESFSLRTLADKLGVSIMPVREALWQFETEKVIIIESNKKMSINTLTREQIIEIFNLRFHHETDLVRESCLRGSKRIEHKLENALKKMSVANSNTKHFLKWNKEFHFTMYENTNSSITLDIVNNLWLRLAPYFGIHAPGSKIFTNFAVHELMFESFKSQDEQTLVSSFKTDLMETKEYILDVLPLK
ncbi:MAG: GntR family transcriptional regulator [Spirochaetia bacterium]|nr:GntR family transcriptional regulator [Spirochaetia bacterium]